VADVPQNPTSWVPTPKQADLLKAAAEPGLKRSIAAICRSARVDRSSFYAWMNGDPGFKAAWSKLWEDMLATHFNAVTAAMLKKAQDGSIGAGRLIAEMKGVLTKRVEVSGKDGEPIGIALKVEQLTDEQLKALVALDPTLIKGGKQ
jgi:hypothetical protein